LNATARTGVRRADERYRVTQSTYKEETMNEQPGNKQDPAVSVMRRRLIRASTLALAVSCTYGAAPFFGPWKHNHVWSQTAQKKPLVDFRISVDPRQSAAALFPLWFRQSNRHLDFSCMIFAFSAMSCM
jgi:hypothetical protein